MDKSVRDTVYSILSYGLDLHARLEEDRGTLNLSEEQQQLSMLLNALPNRGDSYAHGDKGSNKYYYFGLAYPLVCWLDEIFIMNSKWSKAWNEKKLEWAKYKQQPNRAWRFWEQLEIVQDRTDTEALEIFYLCIVLGFRGDLDKVGVRSDLNNEPVPLHVKLESIKKMIGGFESWKTPMERTPRTFVPPLSGAERKQQMLFFAATSGLIMVFLVVFVTVLQLGQ